jgi:hypothetical protein
MKFALSFLFWTHFIDNSNSSTSRSMCSVQTNIPKPILGSVYHQRLGSSSITVHLSLSHVRHKTDDAAFTQQSVLRTEQLGHHPQIGVQGLVHLTTFAATSDVPGDAAHGEASRCASGIPLVSSFAALIAIAIALLSRGALEP